MVRPLERWGEWRLGRELCTLEYKGQDPFFDVGGIKDAEDVVRQLFEINGQRWASPQAMKELIDAIKYLLDPDDNYRLRRELREQYEARTG